MFYTHCTVLHLSYCNCSVTGAKHKLLITNHSRWSTCLHCTQLCAVILSHSYNMVPGLKVHSRFNSYYICTVIIVVIIAFHCIHKKVIK